MKQGAAATPERKGTEAAAQSAVEIYREIILENIEYDFLIQNRQIDRGRLDEILDLMLETVCSARKVIRIAGDDYPAQHKNNARFIKNIDAGNLLCYTILNRDLAEIERFAGSALCVVIFD